MTKVNRLPQLVGRVPNRLTVNRVYVNGNRNPHRAVAVTQHLRPALQDKVQRKRAHNGVGAVVSPKDKGGATAIL